jgi:hypothetical protein
MCVGRRVRSAVAAIAYARRWRSHQAPSIATQRKEVEAWARVARVTIAQWFVDRGTAALEDLPALSQALASLGPESRVLCVARPEVLHDLPRLRTVVEHVAISVGGRVTYAAATIDDPSGDSELRQALDVHERFILRLQVARSSTLKQRRDTMWGRCPWGYRLSADGMHLEPNAAEQAVETVIKHMRLRGLKLRQIRDELVALGVVGRTGKPMGITRIYALLDQGQGSRPHVLARPAVDPDAPPQSVVRQTRQRGQLSGEAAPAENRAMGSDLRSKEKR